MKLYQAVQQLAAVTSVQMSGMAFECSFQPKAMACFPLGTRHSQIGTPALWLGMALKFGVHDRHLLCSPALALNVHSFKHLQPLGAQDGGRGEWHIHMTPWLRRSAVSETSCNSAVTHQMPFGMFNVRYGN